MFGSRVYLSDHFSLNMLPYPLPATTTFREITLEEAREILSSRFEITRSWVESANKAHILMSRLKIAISATRNRGHLRSDTSLIVAEMDAPDDKIKIWENLSQEAINNIPVKFISVEIEKISPDSI